MLEGFNHSLDNATRLHKIAVSAASQTDFGIGCSLNILAAEEAIKAIACFGKHFAPDDIEDFELIFKDHKIKHKGLTDLLNLVKNLKTIGLSESQEKYYQEILDVNKSLRENPPLSTAEISKRFPIIGIVAILRADEARILVEANRLIKGIKEIDQNVDEIIDWLTLANSEKNKGFYVGLENNKWQLPSTFSEPKFQTENSYVEAVLEYVIQLKPLLHLYFTESPTFHPEEKPAAKTLSSLFV